jgi:hypothetical protein
LVVVNGYRYGLITLKVHLINNVPLSSSFKNGRSPASGWPRLAGGLNQCLRHLILDHPGHSYHLKGLLKKNDFLNHTAKTPRGWGYAVFGSRHIDRPGIIGQDAGDQILQPAIID